MRLPKGWTWSTIKEACSAIVDCEHKTAPYVEGSEYLVVRTNNVKNGNLDFADMKYTSLDGYNEWTKRTVPVFGDILFTREAPAGESCIVPKDHRVCMGQRMVLLRPDIKKSNFRYLSMYLSSLFLKQEIHRLQIGTTVSRINIQDIKKIRLPVPPLPEQEKIAEILSCWDSAIEKIEKLIDAKTRFKKGLAQYIFDNLKDGKVTNCTTKTLGEIASFQNGFAFKSKFFDSEPVGPRLIRNRDLKSDETKLFYNGNFDESYSVKQGDLLIGMDADFIPFLWKGEHAVLNQRVGRIQKISDEIDKAFLFYALHEPLKRIEIQTSSTTVKHLSAKKVIAIKLSIPPLSIQKLYSSTLSFIDLEIETLQLMRIRFEQQKSALMQQLLTGKVRVSISKSTNQSTEEEYALNA